MSEGNWNRAELPEDEIETWIGDSANWRVKGADLVVSTASGENFYPCKPANDDVIMDDVARGLAGQSRFNGQINTMSRRAPFFSVAQHAVILFYLAEDEFGPDMARVALLKDAPDAYLGHVVEPLRAMMPSFKTIARITAAKVFVKLGLDVRAVDDPALTRLDAALTANENRDLRPLLRLTDAATATIDDVEIEIMGPDSAYRAFARRFDELFPGHGEIFDL